MKHFPTYQQQTVQALETGLKKQVAFLRTQRDTNYRDFVEDVVLNVAAVLANVGEHWIAVGGQLFEVDMVFECAPKIAYMLDRRGEVNYS